MVAKIQGICRFADRASNPPCKKHCKYNVFMRNAAKRRFWDHTMWWGGGGSEPRTGNIYIYIIYVGIACKSTHKKRHPGDEQEIISSLRFGKIVWQALKSTRKVDEFPVQDVQFPVLHGAVWVSWGLSNQFWNISEQGSRNMGFRRWSFVVPARTAFPKVLPSAEACPTFFATKSQSWTPLWMSWATPLPFAMAHWFLSASCTYTGGNM